MVLWFIPCGICFVYVLNDLVQIYEHFFFNSLQILHFAKSIFFFLIPFSRISGNRMDLQMFIRPYGHDGLIFWSGEDQPSSMSYRSSSTQDFIALGFHKGGLQLRYNLGSGEARIGYNDSRLFDGEWHFIRVQR